MQYKPRGWKKAKCDFYITDSAKTITCAAWCCDLQQKLEFTTWADKDDWLAIHCVRRAEHATCPRAKELRRGGRDHAGKD